MKISAVVVTHNRLRSLKVCLSAINAQTRPPDEILVINNASSDGTQEWLKSQPRIIVIAQPNSGGAGGFHTGIKSAYERGAERIWCMDDDCKPDKRALELLLGFECEKDSVLNSLIVSNNNTILSFGFWDNEYKRLIESKEEVKDKKYLLGAGFFNSTLFPRSVISIVGYPNAKLFIYGDEYEFYLRCLTSGIVVLTIPQSIVYHPEQRHKNIGKGRFFYRYNFLSGLGVKYFPRNQMTLCCKYKEYSIKRLLKTYLYDIYGLIFIQKKFNFLFIYLTSILLAPIFLLKNRP